MRLVATIAAVFVAALIFATNSQKASAESQQQPKPKGKIVLVKPGDSLSKIAKANKSTYQRIFYANKSIKNPDLIYPDTKLRIPSVKEKLKERPLPQGINAPATEQTSNRASSTYVAPRPSYSRVGPAPIAGISGDVWDRLAACEAGGNWAINTGNGFYGGLQFTLSSWQAVGGQGYPHQASKAEQIARGKLLQARQGWGAWPACTSMLGIR